MKKSLLFLTLIIFTLTASSQKPKYNTKDGYMANGYDVVSYFNNTPQKGKVVFSYTYNNLAYKFSSLNNLNTFKKNPTAYIPQYGGWCAYAMGTKNKKYKISPTFYEIKDDKLYLFYKGTLKKWNTQGAEKLRVNADKNWKQVSNTTNK